jgi:hypothetical protein
MSVLDKLKQMLKGHEQQVGPGADKAADLAKKKAGGKYDQQIDTGRDKIKGEFGTQDRPKG